MLLPALLPKSLLYLQDMPDDATLFKTLKENPPLLIKFLVNACDDETWAADHSEFMRTALTWVTEEFFQDRLLMEAGQKVARGIREHYNAMQLYFPLNLTVKLKDKDFQVNSLLYSSSSEYLREYLRRECRDAKSHELNLRKIGSGLFGPIHEFLTTGSTFELYRSTRNELNKILKLAMLWGLDVLSVECQNHMKKYLTRENMFEMTLKAHLRQRKVLLQFGFDYINSFKLGFRLEGRDVEGFGFEFIHFHENSLEAFALVKEYITHLICSERLPEEPEFVGVVQSCPKLICLDISRTKSYADNYKEIPQTLLELELASCLWLNNETFTSLVKQCPLLTRLVLTSDVRIDCEGWGILNKLEQLRSLDLTRCSQIRDEELRIILQACKGLLALSLEDCRALSDEGFNDIPKYHPDFTNLNLARTGISDLPLIEIATQCPYLTFFNLTRCDHITAQGLLEVVKNANHLKELNLTSCSIPKRTLAEIKKIKPYLKIII